MPRLWRFALEHLLLLPLGAAIALVWANTEPESYYRFTYAIAFAVNDVAMVFFFALMTKEVVEATAPGGVLHPWRRALLPVIAAIGATLVPALIYVRVVDALDEPVLRVAWPVAFATDIAVSYFVARIIFARAPDRSVRAAARDRVATRSGSWRSRCSIRAADLHSRPGALIMAVAIAIAAALRRARVKSFWPYLLGAGQRVVVRASSGAASIRRSRWCRSCRSCRTRRAIPDSSSMRGRMRRTRSANSRSCGDIRRRSRCFFFGLVNAGVPFHALEPGTLGLPIAVIVGKPLGVLLGAGVALAAGLHLPHRVGWRELIVVGFAAAIGFSVGAVLLRRAAAAGPAALGNQHGRAAEPRRGAARVLHSSARTAAVGVGGRRPSPCSSSDGLKAVPYSYSLGRTLR